MTKLKEKYYKCGKHKIGELHPDGCQCIGFDFDFVDPCECSPKLKEKQNCPCICHCPEHNCQKYLTHMIHCEHCQRPTRLITNKKMAKVFESLPITKPHLWDSQREEIFRRIRRMEQLDPTPIIKNITSVDPEPHLKDWEEEFYKEFDPIKCFTPDGTLDIAHGIIKFIRSLLSQQRKKVEEELTQLFKKECYAEIDEEIKLAKRKWTKEHQLEIAKVATKATNNTYFQAMKQLPKSYQKGRKDVIEEVREFLWKEFLKARKLDKPGNNVLDYLNALYHLDEIKEILSKLSQLEE